MLGFFTSHLQTPYIYYNVILYLECLASSVDLRCTLGVSQLANHFPSGRTVSRHHNTKHLLRSRSNYKKRLEARGLSSAPKLADVFYLRRKQTREQAQAEYELNGAA